MNDREWIDLIEKTYSSMTVHMSLADRRRHASAILLSAKTKGIDFEDWNKEMDLYQDAQIEDDTDESDDPDDDICPECGLMLGDGYDPFIGRTCETCEGYQQDEKTEREIDEEIDKS